MLCYHLEAKDYAHEGLVEEEVDVEKTQKSEQKVEKGFSTMFPVLWSYDNAPAVDESYEIPAPLDLLTSKLILAATRRTIKVQKRKTEAHFRTC